MSNDSKRKFAYIGLWPALAVATTASIGTVLVMSWA